MKIDAPRSAEFEGALELAYRDPDEPQPLCEGKWAEFSDYVTPPDEQTCIDMCAPCPLLDICRENARATRPSWGIQGGIAWKQGRQAHWLVKLGHYGDEVDEGS